MKKILSIIGYSFLSMLLFTGGVALDISGKPDRDVSDFIHKYVDDRRDDGTDAPDGDGGAGDESDGDSDRGLENASGDGSDGAALDDRLAEEGYLFYESKLNYDEKQCYDQISRAIANEEKDVMLAGVEHEMAKRVFNFVLYDHPEYFWCEGSYSYVKQDDGIKFIFSYNCTGEERLKKQRAIEEKAGKILAGAPSQGTDYEKVRYVFETLVEDTDYDRTAPDNQNIYSVFGNGVSVCAGYAKSTKYLLDRLGVNAIYVVGMAGESHAWNIVECDGKNYCMDTTWGDPTYNDTDTVTPREPNYVYLCCTYEFLSRTHTPEYGAEYYPSCTDSSLMYYKQEGKYFEDVNLDKLCAVMSADMDAGKTSSAVQFASKEAYNQAVKRASDLIEMLRKHQEGTKGSVTETYYYTNNDDTYVLSIIW